MLSVTFFAILLTGSRGGFVYIGLISALLLFFEIKNGIRLRGKVLSGLRVLPTYALFGILGAGLLGAAAYLDYARNPERSAVLRIINTFYGDEAGAMSEDASIEGRFLAQSYYLKAIGESPIWGHGLGASAYDLAVGNLFLSSHNNILETTYNYGIPMALAMYGFLFYLAFNASSRRMKMYFRLNMPLALLTFIMAASLVTNIVFEYRVFPVALAFWISMLLYNDVRPASRGRPA
jgi:O-antigen ligase